MKRLTTTMLALVMAVMFAARTQAEMKPLVVVSVAKYSELASDIDYLGALGGEQGASNRLAALMELMLNVRPSDLLNVDLPVGIVVGVDNDQFRNVAFIPAKDPDKVFGIIQGLAGVAPEDAGGGVKKFSAPNGMNVFVKSSGDWLYAAQAMDDLTELPADPTSIFGELADSYDLGIRAYLQNIPAEYREEALDGLMEGMQGFGVAGPELEMQIAAMKQLFDELDQLTIGLNIDPADKSIYLDLSMSAVPGSSLARQMAASDNLTTRFGGFTRDDALLSMSAVGRMTEADIQAAKSQMAQIRQTMIGQMTNQPGMSDEDREFLEDWANGIMDMVADTIETGKGDFGLAVIADDHISGAMGMHVADGTQAEALFEQFVGFVSNKGEPIEDFIERNAVTVDGVRFHTITPPADGMGEEERAILGDAPVFALGIAEDAVYVGFGTGIIESIKEMMEQSKSMTEQTVLPFRMTASVASIANFAGKVAPQAAAFAGAIQPGDDHIRITSSYEGVTSTTRIKVEEGVLRFMASLGQQFGQIGGPIQ